MSNWISITETRVRTAKLNSLLDAVQGRADLDGQANPLPEIIGKCLGRIQSAVMAGNDLDTDATKIPAMLEWLALNLIIRELHEYLGEPLTEQQKQQQRSDDSYLNDILRTRQKFLPADSPAGTGAVNAGYMQTVQEGNTGNAREDLSRL